jgi:phosphate transport system permease protein
MIEPEATISRPPTPLDKAFDRILRGLTFSFAWLTVIVVVVLVWKLALVAEPAIQKHGWKFLTTDTWDAGKEQFGIRPEIWGTLYSSLLGTAIGSMFGLAVAIFLTQDFVPPRIETFLKNVVDLLAAIPSVVYGLWGIFVVIPTIRPVCNWLYEHLYWIPIFSTRLSGPGLLPAALVLAIMVLPTVTAISRDSLSAVPPKLREAAYGLGATRWEVILAVIVPTAARGVYGAIILALGRAIGETMALAMLVGNSNVISWSVFGPADTLAALLANHFAEASRVEVSALMYAALVLMAITLAINIVGALVISRTSIQSGAVK